MFEKLYFIALAVVVVTTSVQADSCTCFVSPKGSDAAAGGIDSPFATIQFAINSVRSNQGSKQICLRGNDGIHFLKDPVQVSSNDNGTIEIPLEIIGYGPDIAQGLYPIVSGGRPYTGFQKQAGSSIATLQLPADTTPFSLLFVQQQQSKTNGWRQRARMPNTVITPTSLTTRGLDDASTFKWTTPLAPPSGTTWPDVDTTGFHYNISDPIKPTFHNLNDIQVLYFQSWTAFWANVSSINEANTTLLFEKGGSVHVGQYEKQGGRRYILENVYEGLDMPGEWYWDKTTNLLSIIPLAEEEVTSLQVIAPQITSLVEITKAENVMVSDIKFMHADVGERANTYFSFHAAIELQDAKNVKFDKVSISNCGADGISVIRSNDITIQNTSIRDMGGNGITLEEHDENVYISNNIINNTALIIYGQPGGMRLKGASNITAVHNTVGFSPYAGIKIGWQTGTDAAHSDALTNPWFYVANNLVHNYGLGILSDFGGIYLSSNDNLCFQKSPQTCYLPAHVKDNHIHSCHFYDYGCQALYMDEQVSGVLMTGNLMHDLGGAGFQFHCGTNNTAINNVVGFASQQANSALHINAEYLSLCNGGGNPTWPNISHGFSFKNNIVYIHSDNDNTTQKLTDQQDVRDTLFENNIYFAPSPKDNPIMFPNPSNYMKYSPVNFSQWQSVYGKDKGSLNTDPMFANVEKRDFTLLSSSPALKLGTKQLNVSQAGAQGNPFELSY
eukprot:m.68048 g.68048  ORF g.68048 m.68048 type:complete len:728 (-) comp11936_c0_seq2:54-2237(-)